MPHTIVVFVADLINYRLSAAVSPLCHGDPNWPSSRHPRSGPPVAVPSTAGGNSEPMDEDTIYQPVVAYFTFTQNNLAQITSGNALQVMREAEQRHLQIVHGVVDSIKNDWPNRLTKHKQEYEQRLQDTEAKEIAAIAEEKAWWRTRGQIESGSGNTWCQGWGVQGRGKHQAWSKDCRGKATYHKGIWSLLCTNSGTC